MNRLDELLKSLKKSDDARKRADTAELKNLKKGSVISRNELPFSTIYDEDSNPDPYKKDRRYYELKDKLDKSPLIDDESEDLISPMSWEQKMNLDLEALYPKNKEKDMMDDMRRKAKMDMLKDLHKESKRMLKNDKMEDSGSELQKVSVMAPDKERLKQGLDMAKDVVEDMPGDEPASDKDIEHALSVVESLRGSLDEDQLQKVLEKLKGLKKSPMSESDDDMSEGENE